MYLVNQILKYYHFRCCTQKLVVSRAVAMLNDELILIMVWSATGEAVIHCWVHSCRLLLLLGTGDPGLPMVAGAGVVPLLLRRVLGDRRHGARQERTGDNARQWRARHRAPHVDLLQKINISK